MFFCRRHADVERLRNERQSALKQVKSKYQDQIASLQETVRQMTSRAEKMEAELRRRDWEKEDVAREKDAVIEK